MAAQNTDSFVDIGRLETYHNKVKRDLLDNKVDKETGKSLIEDTKIDKLDLIEDEAQVNVIESIAVANENIVTVTDKAVEIDLSQYAKAADIASAYKVKGTKATYADLPANPEVGDVWNITAADDANNIKAGDNVVWTGAEWDNLGGTVDLSDYWDKTSLVRATDDDILSIF